MFPNLSSYADESGITEKLAGRIVNVHANDAIRGRSPDEQLDQERTMPCDTGVIDLRGFVRGLRAAGYRGPVSVEPFMPELRQREQGEVAQRASEALGDWRHGVMEYWWAIFDLINTPNSKLQSLVRRHQLLLHWPASWTDHPRKAHP